LALEDKKAEAFKILNNSIYEPHELGRRASLVTRAKDDFDIWLATTEAPLHPEAWEPGQQVCFIKDIDYGPRKGDVSTIVEVFPGFKGKKATENQLFLISWKSYYTGVWWTTTNDVVLADNVPEKFKTIL